MSRVERWLEEFQLPRGFDMSSRNRKRADKRTTLNKIAKASRKHNRKVGR